MPDAGFQMPDTGYQIPDQIPDQIPRAFWPLVSGRWYL